MNIDEAKEIYWLLMNCLETDCDGLLDCETCDYDVTDEQIDEAYVLLKAAGLVNEEGELI